MNSFVMRFMVFPIRIICLAFLWVQVKRIWWRHLFTWIYILLITSQQIRHLHITLSYLHHQVWNHQWFQVLKQYKTLIHHGFFRSRQQQTSRGWFLLKCWIKAKLQKNQIRQKIQMFRKSLIISRFLSCLVLLLLLMRKK